MSDEDLLKGISKAKKDQLVRRAIEIARENSYCDETTTVLRELGFDIPANKFLVTLQVELDADLTFDIKNSDIYVQFEHSDLIYDFYTSQVRITDVKPVS